MKKLSILFLIVLLFSVTVTAETVPLFKIVIDDTAQPTDVILSIKIISALTAQGYEFPVGVTKLFSEIDTQDLDKQVILLIRNEVAIIVVGEASSTDYVKFSVEVSEMLDDLDIEHEKIMSDELNSGDLSDIFYEKNLLGKNTEPPDGDFEITGVTFEPGFFLLNSYEKVKVFIRYDGISDYLGSFYISYGDGKRTIGEGRVQGITAGETKEIHANVIFVHEDLDEIEFKVKVGDKIYDTFTKSIEINDANCMDTDKSLPDTPSDPSHFTKGTTSTGQEIFYDTCTNFPQAGSLKEYECSDKGQLIANEYYCDNGCNDGACIIIHECNSSEECEDDNACTIDFCMGTPKRKCEYTKKDGCEYGGNCIPISTRLDTQFCDLNSKLIPFKQNGESCNNDYECESGNCFNSVCKPVCDGCLTNDNLCTPYGTRLAEKYCDISGIFYAQKDESQPCSNLYECKSGVCVDNQCISQSLIQKILSWFKNLFG